jgi:hypothetical protein
MRKRYLTKEQDIKIKKLYGSGLSTAKISKLFGVSPETIRTSLSLTETKIRSRKEACTKYMLNSSFFESIDSEEKAYWLGFITADGGIVNHQLVLSLKSSDIGHIELFRKAIGSTHPIKNVRHSINGKEIWQPRLTISSVQLIKTLQTLGVGEKKSLTVKPPLIQENLQIAYWRGYFDGDGHIFNSYCRPTLSRSFAAVQVTGNKYMLKGFADFMKKRLNIISKIEKDKSVYRIRYGKRLFVYLVAKLLYSDSNIYLNRKYNIAKTVFQDDFFHLRKNSKHRANSPASQAMTTA